MSHNTESFVNELIAKIQLGQSAERLLQHPDYRQVFEQHLFNDRIISLVSGLARHPQSSLDFQDIVSELVFLSRLMVLIPGIAQGGVTAQMSLNEARELISSGDL